MTSLGDLKRQFLLTHLYCSPTCGTLLRTKTRYYRTFRNRELSKVKLAVIDKFRKTQDSRRIT
jgi:hypothetical protein